MRVYPENSVLLKGQHVRSFSFRLALLCVAISGSALPTVALAFDINDCIINNMKGVTSDVAARAIKSACDQKEVDARISTQREITKPFGQSIETSVAKLNNVLAYPGGGFLGIQITNISKNTTVKYVRLRTWPAPAGGAACITSGVAEYAYEVTLAPRKSLLFQFPSSSASACIEVVAVFGKDASWQDYSMYSSIEPLKKDPLQGLAD